MRLWDVTTGQCVFVMKNHTAPVYSVDFSADGKYITSGSFDSNVFVWSAEVCLN